MRRFRCDKSIILSTILQHSKSPSGTFFFVMFRCTALVVLRNGSLLQGVFILTKAHAEAQPRISPSSNVLSSSLRVLHTCEETQCCYILFPLRRGLCMMDASISNKEAAQGESLLTHAGAKFQLQIFKKAIVIANVTIWEKEKKGKIRQNIGCPEHFDISIKAVITSMSISMKLMLCCVTTR